jgi:hypothetical protein
MKHSSADIDYLLSPVAVRERSKALYEQALQGRTNFKVNLEFLPEVSKYVLEVTRSNYPDLQIPFHSRFGHFQAGKVDRLKFLNEKIAELDEIERARVKVDLAIVSVLLDAGAGMAWKYKDQLSGGKEYSKSEGLAIASLDLFLKGAFHSEGKPAADAKGLQAFTKEKLEAGFQVTAENPLLGIEGRVALLNTLGKTFEGSRPGALVDEWLKQAKLSSDGKTLKASAILNLILRKLGPIWPGRISLGGVNLGDVWSHSLLGTKDDIKSLVPFHKLSQWMSYSLMEPLMECGLNIILLDELTGLPEYRNGGLLLDTRLIELRDLKLAEKEHTPDSELIIEWRALTVTLLDQIGDEVRRLLNKTAVELPLVKVLEGGTWHAGRKIAAKLRTDGGPPLKIKSDGTVF